MIKNTINILTEMSEQLGSHIAFGALSRLIAD